MSLQIIIITNVRIDQTFQLQYRILEEDFYIKDIKLIDANKDGNMDLLVAVDSDYGEEDEEDWAGSLRVYEIPQSENFKLGDRL